jgi:hypothetical protein
LIVVDANVLAYLCIGGEQAILAPAESRFVAEFAGAILRRLSHST